MRYGQAEHIVKLFGGPVAVARILHKNRTSVWRWFQPTERGGSDGLVPNRALTKLEGLAREHGVFLSEADKARRPLP